MKWKRRLKSVRLVAPLFLASIVMWPAQATQNLPAPGTYVLPRIYKVPRTSLLDTRGEHVWTDERMLGGLTLLGFFYSHCEDANGCPVSWSVFENVRDAAKNDPILSKCLRLMFISLDPERDTPKVLSLLENDENRRAEGIPWSFLTGASESSLSQFIRTMGQDIGYGFDAGGSRTGEIQHMLKVFLVDPEGWVREIYSIGFLTPEAVLNDARTIAIINSDPHARTEVR